jgi:hypothetical protein
MCKGSRFVEQIAETAGPSTTLRWIPVELGGFGKLRPAFLQKAAHVVVGECSVARNPGTLRSG